MMATDAALAGLACIHRHLDRSGADPPALLPVPRATEWRCSAPHRGRDRRPARTSGAIVAGHAGRRSGQLRRARGAEPPDATLNAAEEVPAGPFTPPGRSRALTVPAFCRVAAVATPRRFPHRDRGVDPGASELERKLLGTGNGGFAGSSAIPRWPRD